MCGMHYTRVKTTGDIGPAETLSEAHQRQELCSVPECGKAMKATGLCAMHYWRVTNNGTLDARKLYFSAEESFTARTREVEGGCIEWTAARQNNGYGVMRIKRKAIRVHRYAWERVNGPIPEGMHIDHLCHNRACVNVKHLRVVTQAENNQNFSGARSDSKSGIRGVYEHKQSGRWVARVAGTHIGMYATKDEAATAAENARRALLPFSQN